MPTAYATVNGTRLFYLDVGAGELVVMSHSYLVDHRQFEHQIDALSGEYRVVAFDHRDHGRSDRTTNAYDVETLYSDATELIESLDAGPCHFIGLSTGGFIGARIAIRAPEMLRSLTLMDTSGDAESLMTRAKYESLLVGLRVVGTRPLLGAAMKTMFSDGFLRNPENRQVSELWARRIAANDPAALIRFGRAIFPRPGVLADLAAITTPTLVVTGDDDHAFPLKHSKALAATIPRAKLKIVPEAGHLSTIEQPERVSALLHDFITAHVDAG